jgi:hypothetical protein
VKGADCFGLQLVVVCKVDDSEHRHLDWWIFLFFPSSFSNNKWELMRGVLKTHQVGA